MEKLEALMYYDGLYYIGDLIDCDGDGWVDAQIAIELLNELGI